MTALALIIPYQKQQIILSTLHNPESKTCIIYKVIHRTTLCRHCSLLTVRSTTCALWGELILLQPRINTNMYQSNRSFSIPPSQAYPGHLTSFLPHEGGNLITTHRGWGIWSLASMSCYKINHGRDVKLWWIQRKRLRICGGSVENQRTTQAVLRIWKC